MSEFGDADPEDAWDDDDPLDEKMSILERVVDALRAARDDGRHDVRRADALRLVGKLERLRREPERIARLRAALEES